MCYTGISKAKLINELEFLLAYYSKDIDSIKYCKNFINSIFDEISDSETVKIVEFSKYRRGVNYPGGKFSAISLIRNILEKFKSVPTSTYGYNETCGILASFVYSYIHAYLQELKFRYKTQSFNNFKFFDLSNCDRYELDNFIDNIEEGYFLTYFDILTKKLCCGIGKDLKYKIKCYCSSLEPFEEFRAHVRLCNFADSVLSQNIFTWLISSFIRDTDILAFRFFKCYLSSLESNFPDKATTKI